MVTIFRELRSGVTEDGRTKLKSPSGTLSHRRGDLASSPTGSRSPPTSATARSAPEDLAGGLTGAVVQDPVQDKVDLAGVPRGGRARARRLGRAVPRLPGAVSHTVFGIRHHGPGSARSLERALDELQPDTVLIEGPPEADALLELAAREDMEPPVALLTYVPDEPARAAFYPFARFSPEWRAIRHALDHDVPVRFMDLPAANKMAARDERAARAACAPTRWRRSPRSPATATRSAGGRTSSSPAARAGRLRGRDRGDGARCARPSRDDDPREERREAYMRQSIRAAAKQGAENVAVVCGAWHAPALTRARPRRARPAHAEGPAEGQGRGDLGAVDLRAAGARVRLRRRRRLARLVRPALRRGRRSRSRAGSAAPRGCCAPRGSTRRAAQVVDAARLAMRAGRHPRPPARRASTSCSTPPAPCCASAPTSRSRSCAPSWSSATGSARCPRTRRWSRSSRTSRGSQRRLRLKPEAQVKEVTLDLRREIDRERSRLLHRLNLLDVPWGAPVETPRAGHVQGGVPARVVPGARARADPRRPLGHDRRGGRRGARSKARAAEEESVGALADARRRRPARRPPGRARGRPAARSPTAPRSTATPPT